MLDLTSVTTIKALLAKYGASPSKTMGQNFLVHALTLTKIIEAADLGPSDTVLEVGPGLGTLTQALAQKAKKVIAVEKDRAMAEILKETLKDYKNVEIIQGNALNYSLQTTHYKLVANLPYYITSPVIRLFLEAKNPPTSMVLMVQKEVAQRICAKPPHMSILAVSVQFYAKAQIISYVSKECFWPKPKVDSAIIKITPWDTNIDVPADTFFTIVKAGFAHPRKQLAGNLATGLAIDKSAVQQWLLKNNLQPTQRAETLAIQDWVNLTNTLL